MGSTAATATAIVPVKRFGAAKQRLADVLDPGARAELAAAMLADVLDSIGRCGSIGRTIVVSGEPSIAATVDRAGAELLDDPDDRGHSQAALIGIEAARRGGAPAVALLPGDCPLLDARELDLAVAELGANSVGVIADRHGAGTNGLLMSPPDAIEPAFGPGSCARHLRLAADTEHEASVVDLPSMGLDLDTGDDLAALRTALRDPAAAAPATAAALARLDTVGAGSGA